MASLDLTEDVHRRYNPLSGNWVLVSPHRAKRPWQGQIEKLPRETRPERDPACYLCPGSVRAHGARNPEYEGTFVFDNDFAALNPDAPAGSLEDGPLFVAQPERGKARVICFSPRHDRTLPELALSEIRSLVDLWAHEYESLGSVAGINHVQIFENKGAVMGCSNPHPHGQIWAQSTVPDLPAQEGAHQLAYLGEHGRTLLSQYLRRELEMNERIVCTNEHFVALVPFWAVWPFETMVVSRSPVSNLSGLTDDERTALADILRRLTTRYDNLFEISFPYSAGFHQAPTDGYPHPEWHLHMHFYPPLLRSATIKKFMVGYEMLGMPQRDITPETSAERLRALSETHYTLADAETP